jgi:hypothetical protein
MGKKKKALKHRATYALVLAEGRPRPSIYEVLQAEACDEHQHFVLRAVAGIDYVMRGPAMLALAIEEGDTSIEVVTYADIDDAVSGMTAISKRYAGVAKAEAVAAIAEAERIVEGKP